MMPAMPQCLAQQKSSTMARARGGAGRGATSSLTLRGMIVMVQRWVGLLSSTDRTWPVIVESPDLTVAVLPLNWAIRKRRTSFWSVVSNVNMKLSCFAHAIFVT
jgi:hypothetical protein